VGNKKKIKKMEIGDLKFINGTLYYLNENNQLVPLWFPVGGGGGLSKSSVLNLINQFGGLAPSYQIAEEDIITTSSEPDIVAGGMTLTPPAGTYLVWFSGTYELNKDNPGDNSVHSRIWFAGTPVATSSSFHEGSETTNKDSFCSIAKVTVDGSQAIEGRWAIDDRLNGSATMYSRNLTALKVKF